MHGNVVEDVSIDLILLLFLEINGTLNWRLYVYGLLQMADLLMHYYDLRAQKCRWQRAGYERHLNCAFNADDASKSLIYELRYGIQLGVKVSHGCMRETYFIAIF